MSTNEQQTQQNQAQAQAAQPSQQSSATSNSATTNGLPANSIIAALSNAFKSSTGENLQHDKIAQLLLQNMDQISELAKQGRLSQAQITQLRNFAATSQQKDSSASSSTTQGSTSTPIVPKPTQSSIVASSGINPVAAFKAASPAPALGATVSSFPISQTLNITNPGPQHYPNATGRPTLTGGFAAGRISGTPSQIARTDDTSVLNSAETSSQTKNAPIDQSMRRSIQDLVFSIDPNVKIEPEVEELLLDIADEFIDSVTNFGCRLAKHRGSDTLEVRDLQLHLERNHNIRIPGFASDETRVSSSLPFAGSSAGAIGGGGSSKKSSQNTNVTLRAQRLAQVAQAKKEAKLM